MIRILRVEDAKGLGPYNYNRHTIEMRRAHNGNWKTPSPYDDGLGNRMTGCMYFGFESEQAFRSWFGGWEAELDAAGYFLTEWEVEEEYVRRGGKQLVFERGRATKVRERKLVEGPQRNPKHRYRRSYYEEHDDGEEDWTTEQSDKSRRLEKTQAELYLQAYTPVEIELFGSAVMGEVRVTSGWPKAQTNNSLMRETTGRWLNKDEVQVAGDSWIGPDWIKRLAEEAPKVSTYWDWPDYPDE
jgi:hypothetical protein